MPAVEKCTFSVKDPVECQWNMPDTECIQFHVIDKAFVPLNVSHDDNFLILINPSITYWRIPKVLTSRKFNQSARSESLPYEYMHKYIHMEFTGFVKIAFFSLFEESQWRHDLTLPLMFHFLNTIMPICCIRWGELTEKIRNPYRHPMAKRKKLCFKSTNYFNKIWLLITYHDEVQTELEIV